MNEELKRNEEENASMDEIEAEGMGKNELEDMWDDIIASVVTSVPWSTADNVTKMVERKITNKIGEVVRRLVEHNVENAIEDALIEVKKQFISMEIAGKTDESEKNE